MTSSERRELNIIIRRLNDIEDTDLWEFDPPLANEHYRLSIRQWELAVRDIGDILTSTL
tara:strand:- start:77 stop:253 length:177 start_codon:yes stop_codon:yes gene_type:complete